MVSNKNISRLNFLKKSALTGVTGIVSLSALSPMVANGSDLSRSGGKSSDSSGGELLYNGIKLPDQWPPRDMKPDSYESMPVPYLNSPPEVIPIDVGRQLFIDDFLIEYTNLNREFHNPVKHEGNPLLTPETKVEKNEGYCPTAAPFSDGCFYDPKDGLFKLYYMAGWFDGVALATSSDGINWLRPTLDVVSGTNVVLETGNLRRDGVSVWLDHDSSDPAERFKMYFWAREGKIGKKLSGGQGYLLTSSDGVNWNWRGKIGPTGDNSTFYYNPFRDKWTFTTRKYGRPSPPWAINPWNQSGGEEHVRGRGRARSYWENEDFLAALDGWSGYEPVFWLGADNQDHKREKYEIGRVPQIYKVDAVGYESLVIGLIQLHHGPPNSVCADGGYPKLTELQLAYSRDGFHWDRSNRETFIGATLEKGSWERAYIHSIGGVCNVIDDNLHFYYTAFQGDESNLNPNSHWNGMYANASTGLAALRRDGFASMDAGEEERILLTRKVKFKENNLFVNVDAPKGRLYVEICQRDGKPILGFTRDDCLPISIDSTKHLVKWKSNEGIGAVIDKPVRIKFYLTNAKIYAFWISKDHEGKSGGATAAGGPGLLGTWDA